MAGRRRISELARELGVAPAEVLVKLAQMGEYVKSAASTIEAPVERRIRESFPVPAAPTTDQVRELRPGSDRTPLRGVSELQQQARDAAANRFNDPFDPLYVRAKVPPRGPYKGAKPSGLKRRILDDYIVPRNLTNGGRRPMSPVEYWANEVFEADEIVTDWADLMFSGLSEDDMLAWMRVLSPKDREKAAALFAEGLDPDEIGFDGRHGARQGAACPDPGSRQNQFGTVRSGSRLRGSPRLRGGRSRPLGAAA